MKLFTFFRATAIVALIIQAVFTSTEGEKIRAAIKSKITQHHPDAARQLTFNYGVLTTLYGELRTNTQDMWKDVYPIVEAHVQDTAARFLPLLPVALHTTVDVLRPFCFACMSVRSIAKEATVFILGNSNATLSWLVVDIIAVVLATHAVQYICACIEFCMLFAYWVVDSIFSLTWAILTAPFRMVRRFFRGFW